MANRVYTILIVTKGSKAPYSLQISRKAVYSVALLLVCLLGGLLAAGQSYSFFRKEAVRLSRVEEENASYRADLEKLESEFYTLLGQVNELEELSREVREIVSGDNGKERNIPSRSGLRPASSLEQSLQELSQALPARAEELSSLLQDAEAYRERLSVTPDHWPVMGRVTSQFGWRRSPFSVRKQFHNGIDIGASYGTVVSAAANGKVLEARYRAGWGNLIVVDHGYYVTYYAHLRRLYVKAGTRVEKGRKIGEVGSTGYSTGPHLHFEIHERGKPIDPMILLLREVTEDGV